VLFVYQITPSIHFFRELETLGLRNLGSETGARGSIGASLCALLLGVKYKVFLGESLVFRVLFVDGTSSKVVILGFLDLLREHHTLLAELSYMEIDTKPHVLTLLDKV
jgi:hypothetical protein